MFGIDTIRCPRCNSKNIKKIKNITLILVKYKCNDCDKKFKIQYSTCD
jgi:transposase-like protein